MQTLNKNHTNNTQFKVAISAMKLKGGRQDLCRQTRFELEGSGTASLEKQHLNGNLKDEQESFLVKSGKKCIPVEKTALCEDLGAEKCRRL